MRWPAYSKNAPRTSLAELQGWTAYTARDEALIRKLMGPRNEAPDRPSRLGQVHTAKDSLLPAGFGPGRAPPARSTAPSGPRNTCAAAASGRSVAAGSGGRRCCR